jgi:hypothetical protein
VTGLSRLLDTRMSETEKLAARCGKGRKGHSCPCSELIKHYAMKTCVGSGCIDPIEAYKCPKSNVGGPSHSVSCTSGHNIH